MQMKLFMLKTLCKLFLLSFYPVSCTTRNSQEEFSSGHDRTLHWARCSVGSLHEIFSPSLSLSLSIPQPISLSSSLKLKKEKKIKKKNKLFWVRILIVQQCSPNKISNRSPVPILRTRIHKKDFWAIPLCISNIINVFVMLNVYTLLHTHTHTHTRKRERKRERDIDSY